MGTKLAEAQTGVRRHRPTTKKTAEPKDADLFGVSAPSPLRDSEITGLSGCILRRTRVEIPETAYRFLRDWMHEDPTDWFEARLYESIIGTLEQVSLPKMKELERRRKIALDAVKSEYKELEGEEWP